MFILKNITQMFINKHEWLRKLIKTTYRMGKLVGLAGKYDYWAPMSNTPKYLRSKSKLPSYNRKPQGKRPDQSRLIVYFSCIKP